MPLHELPLQKCGSGHWLTEPCPKGECDLLVFEKDTVKLVPVKERSLARGVVSEGESGHATPSIGPVSVGGEAPQSVIRTQADAEEAVETVAQKNAARQKRYRERKRLEQSSDPPSE